MRLTVCQMRDDRAGFDADWTRLRPYVAAERPDVVLLPELPFAPWFGTTDKFDTAVWRDVMTAHEAWDARIGELNAESVILTRPVERDGRRLNECYAAFRDGRRVRLHDKRYLPEEPDYFEASWYERGDGVFDTYRVAGATLGVQICSELWVLDESRRYAAQNVDLIVTPRATPESTREKWFVAGRAAALLAGAYSASSNHAGVSEQGGFAFAGTGWVIDPDGVVLALTSDEAPFATVELDLSAARAAKATYPRYLR